MSFRDSPSKNIVAFRTTGPCEIKRQIKDKGRENVYS